MLTQLSQLNQPREPGRLQASLGPFYNLLMRLATSIPAPGANIPSVQFLGSAVKANPRNLGHRVMRGGSPENLPTYSNEEISGFSNCYQL